MDLIESICDFSFYFALKLVDLRFEFAEFYTAFENLFQRPLPNRFRIISARFQHLHARIEILHARIEILHARVEISQVFINRIEAGKHPFFKRLVAIKIFCNLLTHFLIIIVLFGDAGKKKGFGD